MINPKTIEYFAGQIHNSIPKSLRNLGLNLEIKIKKIFQNQLTNMNFVSRKEFDIQKKILLNTKEKLKNIELRLKKLENMSNNTQMTIKTYDKIKAKQCN